MALRSIFLFSFQLANTLTSVSFVSGSFPLKLLFFVNAHILFPNKDAEGHQNYVILRRKARKSQICSVLFDLGLEHAV